MKKILTISVLIVAAIGLAVLGSMVIGSMAPSEKVKALRSQHDLANLEAGTYRFDPFRRDDFQYAKVLLIKDWDHNIHVFLLPTEGGLVIMPERWWGWGYYHCTDFRPDTDERGSIKKGGAIRCHDDEAPEWMSNNEWIWDYSGKSRGSWMEDIYSPDFETIGTTLYINR